jgi:hypothetical protein
MPKEGTALEDLNQILTTRELAVLEIFKEQEKRVAENICDWNIPSKGKRVLTIEIAYDVNEERKIRECTINPKLKLINRRPAQIEQVRISETTQEIFEVSERQEVLPIEVRVSHS